jgi:hypothetical protein
VKAIGVRLNFQEVNYFRDSACEWNKFSIFATQLQKTILETSASLLEKDIAVNATPRHPEMETVADTVLNPDYVGAGGSLLCLIHCLAPQLIALGSVGLGIGSFFAGEAWNLFFWLTCLVAVWQSANKTVYSRSSLFLWIAFIVFSLGLGYELYTDSEHFVSYIGSILLISAHSYNLHLQSRWRRILKS